MSLNNKAVAALVGPLLPPQSLRVHMPSRLGDSFYFLNNKSWTAQVGKRAIITTAATNAKEDISQRPLNLLKRHSWL